jgi:hypothetical protein
MRPISESGAAAFRHAACRRQQAAAAVGRQAGLRLHRRVAQALVGAALAGRHQPERAGGFDRDGDGHHLAVGFHVFLECLVELHLAGRDRRFAQRCALGPESEALAVHVVAVGDPVADFDGFLVQHAAGKAERRLRLEVVFFRMSSRRNQAGQQGQQSQQAGQAAAQ